MYFALKCDIRDLYTGSFVSDRSLTNLSDLPNNILSGGRSISFAPLVIDRSISLLEFRAVLVPIFRR